MRHAEGDGIAVVGRRSCCCWCMCLCVEAGGVEQDVLVGGVLEAGFGCMVWLCFVVAAVGEQAGLVGEVRRLFVVVGEGAVEVPGFVLAEGLRGVLPCVMVVVVARAQTARAPLRQPPSGRPQCPSTPGCGAGKTRAAPWSPVPRRQSS